MSCPIPPCPVPRGEDGRTSQRVRVFERPRKKRGGERARDANGENGLGLPTRVIDV
jgi:hypothetical protein